MPQLDPSTYLSQLFWLVITFACLYFVLARIALPRLTKTLETRREQIDSDIAAAEKANAEAEHALKLYEEARANAQTRAMEIAHQTREALRADMEARQAELDAELATQARQAETRINDMRTQAMAGVNDSVKELVGDIVEALIGTKATPADIDAALKRQE